MLRSFAEVCYSSVRQTGTMPPVATQALDPAPIFAMLQSLLRSTPKALKQVRTMSASNGLKIENVWDYPRPPALEKINNRLRVVWVALNGEETVIADTKEGYRVLETSHPPTYYLPPDSIKLALTATSKSSFCEWKGRARYFTVQPTSSSAQIKDRIWSYPEPTSKFKPIKDYLSFYASSGSNKNGDWKCFVDDEQVGVQEGDFYGGWVTSNIQGKMKGGPGTWGW